MSTNEKKLLVIGHVWPEPTATAAGQRMFHLLHFFRASGYQIIFGCASVKTIYSEDLKQMDIHEVAIRLNDSGFDDFIRELQPDIVMFDRFITEEQFGWRIAEMIPESLRILNTEDLHSLRYVRRESLENQSEFRLKDWLNADITKRELASIFRSDISLIISSYEMDVLKKEVNVSDEQLFHLPLFYGKELHPEKDPLPDYSDRSDFIFIGNGKHKPNIDAIKWLHDSIWPEIRKELPSVSLHIYGAYLPGKILELNSTEDGFLVHGHIENSRTVLKKSRVNLVPLRYGAGLKGKLVEAMNCGTPSAATEIAREGLRPLGMNLSTGQSDSSLFIEEAIELYRDQSKWLERRASDKQVLERYFNRNQFEAQLERRISEISMDLEGHRQRNYLGSILLHHTAASTKYMSKWIEAKNKLK